MAAASGSCREEGGLPSACSEQALGWSRIFITVMSGTSDRSKLEELQHPETIGDARIAPGAAMKQFLLYLDETNALGTKFIIQDLDETHVFVLAELIAVLQEKVGELMDQNSFPITQK
ncbi:unnamed protein product [Ranitomeya imitator]|uniref:General transcription and DNA repair factor IIH subunit TFB5 n=1 Tax=Ranitomeya imitator TaxID=111125 RepID=A0ABN9M8I7_9NEOB|nr:unnamed protein product [Ranitomeya imitator]